MNATIMRSHIRTTLTRLDLYSKPAEELLLGTAAHESHFKYVEQIGGGPALGYFQMEPNTLRSLYNHYLSYRPELQDLIGKTTNVYEAIPDSLKTNIPYMVAMARVQYLPVREAIPDDVKGQAAYWKEHYNTLHGAGSVAKYFHDYQEYVEWA